MFTAPEALATPVRNSAKMNESRIFAQDPDPKTEKKGFQSKNNEARQKDHGKDYLFGTQSIITCVVTDNNDHK